MSERICQLLSAPIFIKENVHIAKHLIKDYLFYGETDQLKDIKPGEGKMIEIDNEKLAAYRYNTRHLHVVSSVCRHMGCIVHFNDVEKI